MAPPQPKKPLPPEFVHVNYGMCGIAVIIGITTLIVVLLVVFNG